MQKSSHPLPHQGATGAHPVLDVHKLRMGPPNGSVAHLEACSRLIMPLTVREASTPGGSTRSPVINSATSGEQGHPADANTRASLQQPAGMSAPCSILSSAPLSWEHSVAEPYTAAPPPRSKKMPRRGEQDPRASLVASVAQSTGGEEWRGKKGW